jgi:hypothetical protein
MDKLATGVVLDTTSGAVPVATVLVSWLPLTPLVKVPDAPVIAPFASMLARTPQTAKF